MALKVNSNTKSRAISFSWTIENFSTINKKKGECLRSQVFPKLDGDTCEWSLLLYPNGNTQTESHISAFLHCTLNGISSVTAKYSLNLQDKNEKVLVPRVGKVQKEFVNNESWGTSRFITRDKLLPLLIDDVLVLSCSVEWEIDYVNNKTIFHDKPNAQENLLNDLGELMDKSTLSDVSLLTKDGTKFSAHKCVLATRSPVFAAMFEHNMRESKESVVDIKDISANTLKSMLHFIYTSKVDKVKYRPELLAAADKYDIQDLKMLCQYDLIKKAKVENAVNYLILADRHNASILKLHVLKLITKNLNNVRKTKAMMNLSSTQPSLLDDILEAVAEHYSENGEEQHQEKKRRL